MRKLIWGFAGRTYHIVGNLTQWPIYIHVSYENTFDNTDQDSQQGIAWACAPPPLPLNQDFASFVLFTDAILNVLVVKFDKKYI